MRLSPRSKKLWLSFGAVVLLLTAFRIALPSLLRDELNKRLGRLEGPLCAHMEDFDLALLRGGYRVQGLSVSRWNEDHTRCFGEVLRIEDMKITLSWSQLFRGRARLDVDAYAPSLLADELIASVKQHRKGDPEHDAAKAATTAVDVLIPWRIDSFRLSEGNVRFKLLGTNDSAMTLEHASGIISGIEQGRQEAKPILFQVRGDVMQKASLLLAGRLDLSAEPALWDVDYAVEQLELTSANPLLLNRVPMTFTSGTLDVFGEAAGKGEKIDGYAKTIFRDIDVVTGKEHWINFKQGLVELVGSLFFIVAKNHERETVGTVVDFQSREGKFKVDFVGAVFRALAHRSGKHPVRPGLDNRFALPKRTEIPAHQARSTPPAI